jgi:carboxypeptidase T
MRRTACLLLSMVVVFCALSLFANRAHAFTGTHAKMKVRIPWVDATSMKELQALTTLDVMKWTPGEDLILVSNEDQLAHIESFGFTTEVLVADMEEHYASQREATRNFGDYYSYSEMIIHIDQLHFMYPDIIGEKFSIGTTHEGNTIWALKVSDNWELEEADEPEVLFDALHHAREPITVNVLVETLYHIGANYGTDPEVTFLVDNRQTYFVPVVNPDGYLYNETTYPGGGGMWRKNRRDNEGSSCYGVDPNRNYPYMWDNGGISYDPCNDLYLGPTPASEPCVQAMINLMTAHEFIVHDSYHSVVGVILMPWGYDSDIACPDDELFREFGAAMSGDSGYPVGPAGEMINYDCSGNTTDWAYGEQMLKNKIYSYCTEVDGSSFWPNDSEIPGLVAENIPKNLYLMRGAGVFLSLIDLVVSGGNGDDKPDPGETVDLTITLRNDAIITDAENVILTVSSQDAYVQMIGAQASAGSVPARGTAGNGDDPLSFSVDAACPAGHVIELTFDVSADGFALTFSRSFVVGDLPVVFSDDMEAGVNDWTHEVGSSGYSDEWHLSDQRNHTGGGASSWKFGSTGSADYTDMADGVLITPRITLGSYTQLRFWHWMDAEVSSYYQGQAYDGGIIEMAINDAPWVQIIPDGGYTHVVRPSSQPFEGGTPIYSGQFDWTLGMVTLEGVMGDAQFRFRFGSDGNTGGEGWYIDDVSVVGLTSSNQAPTAPVLVSPEDGETVLSPVPALVVQNATDPDPGDELTYGFRVYADELMTVPVASVTGVTEGTNTTTWSVDPPLADGTYFWQAFADDGTERSLCMATASFTTSGGLDVADNEWGGSLAFRGISPNPSHGASMLKFILGSPGKVEARIFDLQGRTVRQITKTLPAGAQGIHWDGRDQAGQMVSGGMYMFRLTTGQADVKGRILLVR